MVRIVLLSLVLSFAIVALANDNKAAFDAFLKTYNLTFTVTEYGHRFGIFNANLNRIQGLKASGHAGVGLNRFAATDPAEFQQLLIPASVEEKILHKNRTGHGKAPSHTRPKRQALPTSYDYRTYGWVTPVKNQAQCGSCWAFAAVAGMETIYKFSGTTMDFSEQQLVDCEVTYSSGCGGGFTDHAIDYVYDNGMSLESAYPYNAADGICKSSVSKPYKGVYYYYMTGEADVPGHIYNYGPAAFYIRVPASFQYYTGGVFDTTDCTNNIVGLHEMLIVGYTPSYWIVKNSWGTGFGVSGYVYFARGKNLCGIANELLGIYGY